MPPPSIYLPVPGPVVDEHRRITREWLLFQQGVVDGLTAAGNVFGPASALDGQIVLFDGTSGQLIRGATGTGYVFATNGVYSVVPSSSIHDFVVMSDGANPANPVNDGNGNFIYVPYTP